jgi:hypothetical protein
MTVPKLTGGGTTGDPSYRFFDRFEDARKLLSRAADQWALGDPEKPPSAEILSQVLDIFEKARFLRRPID